MCMHSKLYGVIIQVATFKHMMLYKQSLSGILGEVKSVVQHEAKVSDVLASRPQPWPQSYIQHHNALTSSYNYSL